MAHSKNIPITESTEVICAEFARINRSFIWINHCITLYKVRALDSSREESYPEKGPFLV